MGRREDNKAKKRADLERAAAELFRRQGYAETSIEQIVAAAGVARGTFYLYFGDKEALFRALVAAVLDPAADALVEARQALDEAADLADTQAAYAVLGQSLVAAVADRPGEALLYYRELRNPGPVGEWLRSRGAQLDAFVVEMVASLMARGLIRSADPLVVALAIVGAIDRLAYAWLEGGQVGEPPHVAREIVELFGQGLVR